MNRSRFLTLLTNFPFTNLSCFRILSFEHLSVVLFSVWDCNTYRPDVASPLFRFPPFATTMAIGGTHVSVPTILEEEETHFLRFGTGVLYVSTEALRDYFNGKHPNLNADLSYHRGLLLTLKKKRVITTAQWNLLFPSSGKHMCMHDDEQQIYTLLKIIKGTNV